MNYDVAIVGGGIAGLSLAIDLARKDFAVVLFEKNDYPKHKVCGEYIAMESHDYLHRLCPDLKQFSLPRIKSFRLTSTGKSEFLFALDPGGFGVSRYLLEKLLYEQALRDGVDVVLHSRVDSNSYNPDIRKYKIQVAEKKYFAEYVCNATGRKSNIGLKNASIKHTGANYVGVKYHVRLERDSSLIEIHSFPGGYCGISDVEDGKSCLCYIVNSTYLKEQGNSFKSLENSVISKNRNLRYIFENAEFLNEKPITVSGIHFRVKHAVENGWLTLGDAAGCIAPITGNGMSMCMRAAAILATTISENRKNNKAVAENYSRFWNKEFSSRIHFSRYLQKLSEYPALTNFSITLLNNFPSVAKKLISRTHGQAF